VLGAVTLYTTLLALLRLVRPSAKAVEE